SATAALFGRRDVVVVASVSCIYGLRSPEKYDAQMQLLKRGEMVDRDGILRKLVDIQYSRNDANLARGSFRVRGETLEVFPAYAETAYRAVFFGDEIEQVQHFDPLTGEVLQELEHVGIWPATHYATDRVTVERAIGEIRDELEARCGELEQDGKPLESHRTAPPIVGTSQGHRWRQHTLVQYGFRLPSALRNRPQTSDEFMQITSQLVFVSATPGDFERNHSTRIVEQVVRPTGIVDPE